MQLLSDSKTLALVQGAHAHDEAALTELYSYVAAPLYRYFMVRTRDPHLAEALQSDVVVRMLDAIRNFQPPATGACCALLAWVFRVASNRLIDHYRSAARQTVPLDDSYVQPHTGSESVAHVIDRTALLDAMGQLTAEQRRVVQLRFLEGRSTDEVAALTGQTVGAVKAMQHRALRTMAALLADGDAETRHSPVLPPAALPVAVSR